MFLGAVLDNTIGGYFTHQMCTDLMVLAQRAGSPPVIRWNFPTGGYVRPGDYLLTMAGKGTIDFSNRIIEVGSGEPIAVTVPPANARGKVYYLTVQKQDAADPIRDIHFWPADLDYRTQQFHPAYLERVRKLYVARSLHFYDVEANQYGGKEVAWAQAQVWRWELYIDLCNTIGARPWINLGHKFDENYCRNLGMLFEARLNRGLKPYVSYSNEIWNWGYPFGDAGGWVRDQGVKLGITKGYRASYAYFFNRAVSAFQEGFGRPTTWIHEGQLANADTIKSSVGFARENNWRVNGVAGAPYVNPWWRIDKNHPNPPIDFRELAPLWLAARAETMEKLSPTPPSPPPPPPPPDPTEEPPVEPPPGPTEEPPVERTPAEGPALLGLRGMGSIEEMSDEEFYRSLQSQRQLPNLGPRGHSVASRAIAKAVSVEEFLATTGAKDAWRKGLLDTMESIITNAFLAEVDRLEPQMRAYRSYADANGLEFACYEWGQGMIWEGGNAIHAEIGTHMQRSPGMARVVERLYEMTSRYASCACQTGYIGPWGAEKLGGQWFGMIETVADSTPKFDAFRRLVDARNP